MITKKSIMEAWTFLREKNYTIPDETLDFMRDVSLKALEQQGMSPNDSEHISSVMHSAD